ncbi:hypothetical protein RHGRI_011572 [Rhododendron griersonianum]|uniref:Uncharacterized protein n=1 Tax=Rhododendron griersonianum TaxID=479676 RepID=A0AAV6KMH1_9ERIC|nr:hypothetical protein RHGRI_011572 [Rhododendron griersonianum]
MVKKFHRIDPHSRATSWVTSGSEGGSPSGIVLNWKSGNAERESGPVVLMNRFWLNSVLTKVMKKPLWWRSFASFISPFMWLCAGNGMNTAWGFSLSAAAISTLSVSLLLPAFSIWLCLWVCVCGV